MIGRLTKRSEFLAAASGRRFRTPRITMQALVRPDGTAPSRVGLTVTRKEGGAVERNRIRRRLRAAIGQQAALVPAGRDIVFIGRRDVLAVAFPELLDDIERALAAARTAKAPSQRDPAPPGSIASPGVTRP